MAIQSLSLLHVDPVFINSSILCRYSGIRIRMSCGSDSSPIALILGERDDEKSGKSLVAL